MPGRDSTSAVPPDGPRGILLEIVQIGDSLRVAAVDEASGVEVSFIAPANTPRVAIERLARAKLHYVLAKKNGER